MLWEFFLDRRSMMKTESQVVISVQKTAEKVCKNRKEKRKKQERKLDKTLEDTFPASDSTAKY